METQILANIFLSFAIYILISVSFSVIYYTVKFFHLAHGAIISLSAYFTYMFFNQINLPIWLSIIFSIILSIFVALVIELLIYKPLRKKNLPPLLFLIASLGIYVVLQNSISMLFGDNTKNIRTSEIEVGNEFLGAYLTDIQIISIVVCLTLFISILIFLQYHRIGRNIRAIGSNAELSEIIGINSNRFISWAIGIGSGLAAVVGILVASDTGLTPTMGFNLLLYGVVAMIIGGVSSTWGLLGGALLLSIAQHLTAFYIDGKWMDTITYLILILFLFWKPLGFSGKRLKKIEI